jgi:F-type H+-transporting ATPase subunit delta
LRFEAPQRARDHVEKIGKGRLSAQNASAAGLAGRYATALFELALERSELDRVEADLRSLEASLEGNSELRRALRSPVVRREEHTQAMMAIADQLGLGEATRNLLGMLAQKRRLAALSEIITVFRSLLASHRGEQTAEVVSAVPLGEEDVGRLKESVARYAGRAVSLTARVDPSLLGGLVIRLGSRMIDASLKTKLQQLELSMRGLR